METPLFAKNNMAVTDVYTDLNGLQKLAKSADKDEALKKVAQQFESMFINMMMKNMRQANAVFEEDSMFKSEESDFYRDMHDHQLSLTLAHSRGIGIADVLYRQLRQSYGSEIAASQPEPEAKAKVDRVAIADSPQSFVRQIMPYLKKAAKALGVEPELLAAQSALETGWGKHMLANQEGEASHNLFNIKRDRNWQGQSVAVDSLEEKNGVLQAEKSEFKAYKNMSESVNDYISLVKGNSRFAEALKGATSSFDFINKLQKAGYATDSKYADKIMSVYKQIKELGGLDK